MDKRIAGVLMAIGLAAQTSAQQTALPFTMCAQSDTWTRPSPDVQSRIWTDNRYKDVGRTSYQWTHDFLTNEPDSASITYYNGNLSGLWTENPRSQCPRRDDERNEWMEIWALNHHVALITIQGPVITVMGEPREKGFEIIQFRRPGSFGAARGIIRFVTSDGRIRDGRILDELIETSPGMFVPASGRR